MGKYIVTGGDGFIGAKINQAVDGLSFDIKSGNDILDSSRLNNQARDCVGIFHCAAKISVTESFIFPEKYFRINVEGTKQVISAAEEYNFKIIFSSSAAVYGESNNVINEKTTTRPQSPYGTNKRECEFLLRKSIIKHVSLRYFNVYGPGQSYEYSGVVASFITNALKGENLIIYGDGQQTRDFVFVDDVVAANKAAMSFKNQSFEIFNIASGKQTTVRHLAETIIGLTGSSSKICHVIARKGDILYSACDINKAKSILDWKPLYSLEEGLAKTIDFYRDMVLLKK